MNQMNLNTKYNPKKLLIQQLIAVELIGQKDF